MIGGTDRIEYQTEFQINGANAHKSIDNRSYSSRQDVLQGIDVYSERYNILGKIDVYHSRNGVLTENG